MVYIEFVLGQKVRGVQKRCCIIYIMTIVHIDSLPYGNLGAFLDYLLQRSNFGSCLGHDLYNRHRVWWSAVFGLYKVLQSTPTPTPTIITTLKPVLALGAQIRQYG
jgi:hypothetical protein